MRKAFVILLAAIMMLSFVACSKDKADSNNTEETASSAPQSSTSTAETPVPELAEKEEDTTEDKKAPIGVTVNLAEQLVSGEIYYQVSYSLDNASPQTGYMDVNGLITSDIPLSYENNGTGFSLFHNGKTASYTPQGENDVTEVKCGVDGIYLVQEYRSSLDGSGIYIGLMDSSANWLNGNPINVGEITGRDFMLNTTFDYLGEGTFAVYHKEQNDNHLLLLHAPTASCTYLQNVWAHNLASFDGRIIYQTWDGGLSGGHRGSIFSHNAETNTETELPVQGTLLASSANGFLIDNGGLSFYSPSGELKWTFDQYKIDLERMTPILYEDYIFAFVCATGENQGRYFGCIDQTSGELVYEPFIATIGEICGRMALSSSGEDGIQMIDLTTGEAVMNFSAGSKTVYNQYVIIDQQTALLELYDNGQRFFNGEGIEIFAHCE